MAIGRLEGVRLVASSSLYRSEPMGPQDQARFLNAVVAVLTELDPCELLAQLQQIELAHGRQRNGVRWGPRTLDLDLLVFGNRKFAAEDLTVPHPGLAQRNFVLYPLAEVAPRLSIPGVGVAESLALGLGCDGLEKLE